MTHNIQPGTKAYLRFGPARDRQYQGPLTVIDLSPGHVFAVDDADPDGNIHQFTQRNLRHVLAPNQTLIPEGTPEYEKAERHATYDLLVACTRTFVRDWENDKRNPGKALAASEALRVLASTPEPPK